MRFPIPENSLRQLLVPVGDEPDELAPVHEPVLVPVRRRDELLELPRRDAEVGLELDGLLQVQGVQPLQEGLPVDEAVGVAIGLVQALKNPE